LCEPVSCKKKKWLFKKNLHKFSGVELKRLRGRSALSWVTGILQSNDLRRCKTKR